VSHKAAFCACKRKIDLASSPFLKSTNMLERLNQKQVIRIFPNLESYLRLIRALAVEIHEGWLETPCYLNMEPLAEQKKGQLRGLELAAA
jgi:transposase-like protein